MGENQLSRQLEMVSVCFGKRGVEEGQQEVGGWEKEKRKKRGKRRETEKEGESARQ